MIGDMLQSTGVIIAALIIKFKPTWTIADPICTFLFSILVMFTTIPIFCDCMRILLEASPEELETVEVYNKLNEVSVFEGLLKSNVSSWEPTSFRLSSFNIAF